MQSSRLLSMFILTRNDLTADSLKGHTQSAFQFHKRQASGSYSRVVQRTDGTYAATPRYSTHDFAPGQSGRGRSLRAVANQSNSAFHSLIIVVLCLITFHPAVDDVC